MRLCDLCGQDDGSSRPLRVALIGMPGNERDYNERKGVGTVDIVMVILVVMMLTILPLQLLLLPLLLINGATLTTTTTATAMTTTTTTCMSLQLLLQSEQMRNRCFAFFCFVFVWPFFVVVVVVAFLWFCFVLLLWKQLQGSSHLMIAGILSCLCTIPGVGQKDSQSGPERKAVTQEYLETNYPKESWTHGYTDMALLRMQFGMEGQESTSSTQEAKKTKLASLPAYTPQTTKLKQKP